MKATRRTSGPSGSASKIGRLEGRLLHGLEARLGITVDRDLPERRLLDACADWVARVVRSSPEQGRWSRRTLDTMPDPKAALGAFAEAVRAGVPGGAEGLLQVVTSHLAGVPASARDLPEVNPANASISLATFQHLVAALAGAQPESGAIERLGGPPDTVVGQLVLGTCDGLLDSILAIGLPAEELGAETANSVAGRALELGEFLRAVAYQLADALSLSRIQIVSADGESFAILAPGEADLEPILGAFEKESNRWLLGEWDGTMRLSLAAVPLAERDASHFGLSLVTWARREETRRARPFLDHLAELARTRSSSTSGGRPARGCRACREPGHDVGEFPCERCRRWIETARSVGGATSGIRVPVGKNRVPRIPLSTGRILRRLSARAGHGELAIRDLALLVVRLGESPWPRAGTGAFPGSIAHFLDFDRETREALETAPSRYASRARPGGKGASSLLEVATRGLLALAGPWAEMLEFSVWLADDLDREMPSLRALWPAAALVRAGTGRPLGAWASAAREGVLRAALRGPGSIEVEGRLFDWGVRGPAPIARLVDCGRAMSVALDSGLDTAFLSWLGSLSERYRVGEADEDLLWQPAFVRAVGTGLSERRHGELRRLLLAPDAGGARVLADVDIPLRFAFTRRRA